MSKAFTTETDDDDNDVADESETLLPEGQKNYMTPVGFARMQEELRLILSEERPKVAEIVTWAAGNGDRSENGDYIYGKKKLRELDRRIRYLMKRLESAEVVDPAKQQNLQQVFFGATVTYAGADDAERTVKLVGVDEIDLEKNHISWVSPLARALLKTKAGDEVSVRTPGGTEKVEIISIRYDLPTKG